MVLKIREVVRRNFIVKIAHLGLYMRIKIVAVVYLCHWHLIYVQFLQFELHS